MDKDIIIPIDFNRRYLNTNHPLISGEDVVLFALTEGMLIKVKQGNDQWKGVINYDSKLYLWFVIIQEGTYRDLTFPEWLSFTDKDKYKKHILWLEEKFLPNRIRLFNNFVKFAHEKILLTTEEASYEGLKYKIDSFRGITEIIKKCIPDIVGIHANTERISVGRNSSMNENEIYNSYNWFIQATGTEIIGIPQGLYDLMLDVSLYFSKVITTKNDVSWIFINNKLCLIGESIQPDTRYLTPFEYGFVQGNVINPFGLIELYFLDIVYSGKQYEVMLNDLYDWVIRD